MFNLYDLLASGYDEDELAQKFADSLNEARTRLQEEEAAKKAAEEAARQEQETANLKTADIDSAVDQLWGAIARHYPNLVKEENRSEGVKSVTDLIIGLLDDATKPRASFLDWMLGM